LHYSSNRAEQHRSEVKGTNIHNPTGAKPNFAYRRQQRQEVSGMRLGDKVSGIRLGAGRADQQQREA